jgi:hypothetical protein
MARGGKTREAKCEKQSARANIKTRCAAKNCRKGDTEGSKKKKEEKYIKQNRKYSV